jgi:hypothetical protein
MKKRTRSIRRRLFKMIALTGMTDPQSERDNLISSFTHALPRISMGLTIARQAGSLSQAVAAGGHCW